jgi:hypothetical protein
MQTLDLEERSALEDAELAAGSSSVGGPAAASMQLSPSIVRRRKEDTGEPLVERVYSQVPVPFGQRRTSRPARVLPATRRSRRRGAGRLA